MIVLDASIVVELLLNTPVGQQLAAALGSSGHPLAVPHLIDVEAMSALRNLASAGRLEPHRRDEVLLQLALLPAGRYSHVPLLPRI